MAPGEEWSGPHTIGKPQWVVCPRTLGMHGRLPLPTDIWVKFDSKNPDWDWFLVILRKIYSFSFFLSLCLSLTHTCTSYMDLKSTETKPLNNNLHTFCLFPSQPNYLRDKSKGGFLCLFSCSLINKMLHGLSIWGMSSPVL